MEEKKLLIQLINSMLSQDQIKNIANKYQTTELNVKREYFQHLFLSYFYQQPEVDRIYFKGGTALRIIYNSARFSEDLDFSSSYTGVEEIEKALESTLNQIEKEGIEVDLEEAKTTSGGFLSLVHFKTADERISIRLEVSLREGEKKGEVVTVAGDFIPPFTIVSLERSQLVDEKIQALLSRKKPRDFYDLYFILRKDLLPPQKKDILSEALKTLASSDINFEAELKQFLPRSQWAIIRNFKSTLETEINRFI